MARNIVLDTKDYQMAETIEHLADFVPQALITHKLLTGRRIVLELDYLPNRDLVINTRIIKPCTCMD